jgi:hypothetical protein
MCCSNGRMIRYLFANPRRQKMHRLATPPLAFVLVWVYCVMNVSANTSYVFNLSRVYAGNDFFDDWDYLSVAGIAQQRWKALLRHRNHVFMQKWQLRQSDAW